jgi:hypothetical protein
MNISNVFKGARSAPTPAGRRSWGKCRARMTLTRTRRSSRRSPAEAFRGNVARLGAASRSKALRATAASAREPSPRPAVLAGRATISAGRASCKSGPSFRRSSMKPGKIARKSASRHT